MARCSQSDSECGTVKALVELREAGIFADEAGADLPGANQVAGVKAAVPQSLSPPCQVPWSLDRSSSHAMSCSPDDPRVLPTGQRIFGHRK